MPRTLAQNAQYIANTIKPAIKSAIEAQGVTVPSTDSFLDYADRIGEISGGGSGYQLKDLPTGSISTVNDAAPLPLNALKVSVEAWQEGTGDPSPSNIRPIHGWDSGEITVCGKNFCPTLKATSGGYGSSGQFFLKKGTYILSATTSSNAMTVWITGNSASDTQNHVISANSTISYSFTMSKDDIVQVGGRRNPASVFDSNDVVVQIELGTTTTYEPYQGKQYTQQFPQTIYGAEWDVNGGMKITHIKFKPTSDLVVRANSSSWNPYYPSYYFRIPDLGIATNRITCISNAMNGVSCDEIQNINQPFACSVAGASNEIDFTATQTSTSDAKQFLLDNDVEFVYELRTPTTISQQPLTPRMLEGVNNLYADCGEVIEGEYFVDEGAHRYQLYDYIESDGTQVIDLGFAPENGATVTTSFVLLSTQTSEAFVYGATDNSAWLGFAQNPASRNTIYENNTSGRSEAYIQNQQYLLTLTASRDYTNHLCMFGFYLNGYAPGIKTRLCYCKYNDNFYLPCKRKSDGVFGLIDITNGTFLTDSASGNAFTGGNYLGVDV